MELCIDCNLISYGDKICVALSGGKDSVALLHALVSRQKQLGITVCAVNVEHGIRKQSKADSLFCKRLCQKLGVELFEFCVDAPALCKTDHLSLEESARLLRYRCFFELLEQNKCNKIATAHHLSDFCETVLLNLFRGASLSGAKGIPSTQNGIIRPLLHTPKTEVDEYVLQNGFEYVTDQTNFDTTYTRNFLRNDVIPQLKQRFPALENSILRFSQTAVCDDDYLFELAKSHVILGKNTAVVSANAPEPLFARACVIALKHLGIKKDYTFKHLESLKNLCLLQTGKTVVLPLSVVAKKQYDNVVFSLDTDERNAFCAPFSIGEFSTDTYCISIEECTVQKVQECKTAVNKSINGTVLPFNTLFFSTDGLPNDLQIRHVLSGDTFTKFGGGTKSVKKFLTDKKISSTTRQDLLVLASGSTVFAVFGVEIADSCKITTFSKRLFVATCKKAKKVDDN